MSATQTGDRPRRVRRKPTTEASDDMGPSHGERLATLEANYTNLTSAMSDVKKISTDNSKKLDDIILRFAKEDGAQESEKSAEESQISFWAKWSGFAIVAGTVAAILQPAISWAKHIIWH